MQLDRLEFMIEVQFFPHDSEALRGISKALIIHKATLVSRISVQARISVQGGILTKIK